MVRYSCRALHPQSSYPHARGDGPFFGACAVSYYPLSPRAWGWSGALMKLEPAEIVIPTLVGMVRAFCITARHSRCYPLARGDGPRAMNSSSVMNSLSPRSWGWSGKRLDRCNHWKVIPSRVGMVRLECRQSGSTYGFPRARGDGPRINNSRLTTQPLSPRAWGWSVRHRGCTFEGVVFPAPVGMVRVIREIPCGRFRFPRARGDGPFFPFSARVR